MTTTTDLWEDGQPEGLGGPKLAGQGFRMLKAHAVPMLAVWVLLTVASAGAAWANNTYHIATTAGLTPEYLGVTLVGGLISALISAFALRTLLGVKPALSFDSGVLSYIGLTLLAGVVPGVIGKLVMGAPPEAGDSAAGMAMLGRGLVYLLFFLAWIYVALKLMLWPMGLLVGDKELTPAKSWSLMRRAFWGYILGAILLGGLPYLVVIALTMGATMGGGERGQVPLLTAPFTALFALAFTAVGAAVYHFRRQQADV